MTRYMEMDPALFPNYRAELADLSRALTRNAPVPLDEAEMFVATHTALCLSRVASDRASLGLLRDWFAPRFNRRSVDDLVGASSVWLSRRAAGRRQALMRLTDLVNEVRSTFEPAFGEYDELMHELNELSLTIADLREQGSAPPGDFLRWAPQRSAVKELRAALAAMNRAYPYHCTAPLNTATRVEAARRNLARSVAS